MSYDFAVNPHKLAISINALKARGVTITEDSVREEYVRRGGKVTDVKIAPVEHARIEDTVKIEKQPEVVSAEPKKRSKKSAI